MIKVLILRNALNTDPNNCDGKVLTTIKVKMNVVE